MIALSELKMSHATFQVSRFDPEWTVGLDWMLSTCGLSEVWRVLSCFPSERILVGKGELRDKGQSLKLGSMSGCRVGPLALQA